MSPECSSCAAFSTRVPPALPVDVSQRVQSSPGDTVSTLPLNTAGEKTSHAGRGHSFDLREYIKESLSITVSCRPL